MAVGKEIKTKIKSIQSTKKITKAMEMVAASKMRKTQDAMNSARPYTHEIRHIAGHIAKTNPEYKHTYMDERKIRKVGYIIVSTDRGLCGGLNINLFKKIISSMQEYAKQGIASQTCVIGSKSESFFKRVDTKIVASVTDIGDNPIAYDLVGAVEIMRKAFEQCEIDKLYICYNDFKNTMSQEPTIRQLLPVLPIDDLTHKHQWDYLYEPDPKFLLDFLLVRYVESEVYEAVLENIASEQAARMVAMKAATDNAGDVIDNLELIYNKARQASITQEISEIVAGAAAV